MDPAPGERIPSFIPAHIEVVFSADGTASPVYQPLPLHGSPGPAGPGLPSAGGAAGGAVPASVPSSGAPSPLATPLLQRHTPQSTGGALDSPSVSVSVLPDAPAGSSKCPPRLALNEDSTAGSGVIRAHYTGSAAKRRSSAASIIRQQLPAAALLGRDKMPRLLPGDLASGVFVEGESEGGANGSQQQEGEEEDGANAKGSSSADRPQPSIFDLLDKRERYQSKWQVAIAAVVDGVPYTFLSLIMTFMVLYSDDFRVAVAPPSADAGFRGFAIFCLAFFMLELLLSSLSKPRYFLGFYFLIDCVATASLLFDIPEFMALLTGQVIRVVRLIRIVKLYKIYAQNRHRLEGGTQALADLSSGEKPSRVGEKLSELTIRKVIIMVLALLFLLPVFETSVGWYGTAPSLDDGGLELLHAMYGAEHNSSAYRTAMQAYLDQTPWKLGTRRTSHLISMFIHNQTLINTGVAELRRDAEVTSAIAQSPECHTGPSEQCFVSAAIFDTKWYNQVQALLNMGRTSFIILILITAALLFMRDADRLVLKPLERMVKQVKSVSENPLARSTVPSEAEARQNGKGQQLETRILENSITKICSLLSVGFGEAGAEVIADNIRSGGDLNPMIPGRKVTAIFGFCDIRQFTDTTEVLQEDVMEFVNSIAKIVHMEVALHGGAANKNIGDAFLLVWKLPVPPAPAKRGSSAKAGSAAAYARASMAPTERQSMELGAVEQHRSEMAFVADAALASFVIIQAAVKRSAKLRQYCSRSDLNSRIPNFSIRMGFGLHVGWAIEGAIGSEFKIDASYLSPHVNMASRLEAATKQFGTTILLSEDFVRLLSPRVRPLVRQIDRVTVKGSRQPMGLYTYDASSEGLDVWTSVAANSKTAKSASSFMLPPSPKPDAAAHDSYSLAAYGDEFREHPDIIMTRAVDAEFLDLFDQGFQAYVMGDWQEARRVLEQCKTHRRNRRGEVVVDGPSQTLLSFMEGHGFEAPQDWRGYRELTEK